MLKVDNLIKYVAIIIFMLGTGSLYFQVLRMPLLALLMIAISVILVLRGKKISIPNLFLFLGITAFYLIDTMLNWSNGFYLNDLIIWLVNGTFILILASNMTFNEFKRKYIIVLVFEAALSILCFLFADILGHSNLLPLLSSESNTGNGFYLTPYYTLGWFNIPVFHRNAGIYWEPGAHQIFLNLALFLLLNDKEQAGLSKFKYRASIIILIIAGLTTMSTTGYFCMAVVLLSVLFKNEPIKSKFKLQLLMVFALCLLILVELQTGVIAQKLLDLSNGHGSGVTRYYDSFYGYKFGVEFPLFGQGIFATNVAGVLREVGVVNISNGMALYAIRIGIIPTAILLAVMYLGIRRKMPYGNMNNFLFFLFVLMCVNTESVFMNLFMLSFMFFWRNEKIVIQQGERMPNFLFRLLKENVDISL